MIPFVDNAQQHFCVLYYTKYQEAIFASFSKTVLTFSTAAAIIALKLALANYF